MPYNFGTEVIQQIPVSDRTEGIKELDFSREPVPMERALGVQWCIESDTFNFTLSLRDRPCTRRGILSTISSIYDLLGFVAPVLLEGKTILQELCRNNTGWDDPVPNDIQSKRLAKLRNSTLLQANKFRKGRQGRDPPLLGCVFQGLQAVHLLENGKREWQNLLLFRTRKIENFP